MQFDDAFDRIFDLGVAGGALGLLASLTSTFLGASEHKLVAATLAHDVTALAKSHDFLVAQFLAANFTQELFGLGVLH